ncbi:hypothetical protein shn_18050 [Shinella sp. HZN7]|nr:hypothetical protein shn_18050 [Shinella sp. HZN7]
MLADIICQSAGQFAQIDTLIVAVGLAPFGIRQVGKLSHQPRRPVHADHYLTQGVRTNARILAPERHLRLGLQSGDRRTQLMRCEGCKIALPFSGRMHPPEETVERADDRLDLGRRVDIR